MRQSTWGWMLKAAQGNCSPHYFSRWQPAQSHVPPEHIQNSEPDFQFPSKYLANEYRTVPDVNIHIIWGVKEYVAWSHKCRSETTE